MSRGRVTRRALPAAAAALVASLLVVASAVLPSPALGATSAKGTSKAAGQGPVLTLESQSNWVTPSAAGGPGTFTLVLSAVDAPADAEVSVSVYARLRTRSGYEATLHTPPSQSDAPEVDHTTPVPLAQLPTGPHGAGVVQLRVAVEASSSTSPAPAAGTPTIDLTCTAARGLCTGVYPAVVSLQSPAGAPLGQFTTYLTYAPRTSADPLRFAWVVPVSAPTTVRAGATDPSKALTPLSPTTARSLTRLVGTLHQSSVPVTLEPTPQTVEALSKSGSAGRAAVATLAHLSTTRATVDETVAQTYVPVDLGGLAAAGEPTEITAQVTAARSVLKQYGVSVTAPTTWVSTGQVSDATGTGLGQVGATHVVVPDIQLARPPVGAGVTWGWPFQLPFGKGPTLTAGASDSVLGSQFAADPGDPALAAAQLVADLAIIHFERPNTATPRGMVAVPAAGWHETARFLDQLLSGLKNSPVVQPVTLAAFFATVPAPTTDVRHLQSAGAAQALSKALAARLSTARLRLTHFGTAVRGAPSVLAGLDQALLAAEADYRGRAGMATSVSAFDKILAHQLSLVQLSTNRTITLTSRTGWIPITVVSAAPYAIRGTLSVSSNKFNFPDSTAQPLTLDHPNNSVRFHVEARTLGDSPLTVQFSVPGLVFAKTQVTVRSTATSVVGVILTVLAVLVLLGWWARSWRTGRRRRAAHEAAGSTT